MNRWPTGIVDSCISTSSPGEQDTKVASTTTQHQGIYRVATTCGPAIFKEKGDIVRVRTKITCVRIKTESNNNQGPTFEEGRELMSKKLFFPFNLRYWCPA